MFNSGFNIFAEKHTYMDFFFYYLEVSDASEEKLLEDFSNCEIPDGTDAAGRYNLLKNYTAMLQFTWSKFKYQVRAIDKDGIPGENDIANINKAVAELNVIRCHRDLSDSNRRSELLREAKLRLIKNTLGEVKDEQHLILLIYLLHDENWFKEFPLPEEAFEIYLFKNRLDMIGLVYGKYFILYDYLQGKLKDLPEQATVQVDANQNKTADKNNCTLKDLFLENNKSIEDYNEVIEALSNKLPKWISTACELPADTQFVITKNGEKMNWNVEIEGSYMYLAGLYDACKNKDLIRQKSTSLYLASAFKSFDLKMSRNAFAKRKQGLLDSKYVKPFQLLFRSI